MASIVQSPLHFAPTLQFVILRSSSLGREIEKPFRYEGILHFEQKKLTHIKFVRYFFYAFLDRIRLLLSAY